MFRPSALALAALLTSGAATATTYTFQQGVAGYTGTRDTAVAEAQPDANFGSELELSIDASDGGLPSQALLRFADVFGAGAGQIALGSVITSATLTLNITSAGSGIRLFDMLTPWNEATITWNSAGNGIQANGVEAAATPFLEIGANDGGGNIPEGTLVLDVTASLQAWASGAVPGYGWALLPFVPNGTNGTDFFSREVDDITSRPLLTVQVAAVPEPAPVALALAGLAGLLAWRRR
jgi:MYXO-CTERM domain-containing protein